MMGKYNKYNYLVKNIGFLTISNFGSKILSFFLIPLYTSVLSTSEYGTYDIYSTTISLLIPILTLNINEAVMRFCLDKNVDKKEVLSIALKKVSIAIVIFISLVIINNYYSFFYILKEFYLFLILLFIVELIYSLLAQFARGLECIFDIAIAGVINSVTMLMLNIFLLLVFHKGIEGYFIANIIAFSVPSIYLIFRLKIWKYITIEKSASVLKKQMQAYSMPLILSNLCWWIINVSDRYIITSLVGVAENGLYSIAYKIPTILNMFQSIFNQAWTISAVKEVNEPNKFYKKIYTLYNMGMILVCSLLILFSKVIARILFTKEFFNAWMFSPLLMVSVVFGALIGVFNGIFAALKKMKYIAIYTSCGAIVNVICNVLFITKIGTIGATIATVLSYFLIWLLCYLKLKKLISFKIEFKRDILAYFLLILQSIAIIIDGKYVSCIFFLSFTLIVMLYKNDIIMLLKSIYDRKS